MQPFGHWLLRSRKNAIGLALVCALLPFLSWLAVIILALVTLRLGAKEGAVILLFIVIPQVGFALYGHSNMMVYNLFAGAIMVYVLAAVLRGSHNWALVLIIGVAIALAVILIIHGSIDNINHWWEQKMLSYLQELKSNVAVDSTEQQASILRLAKFATGLQAAILLLVDFVWLMIARYWQSLLFNPGKFQSEIQNIRLPKWCGAVLVSIMALSYFSEWPVLMDFMPIMLVPFIIAGLSLTHFVVKVRQANMFWLILCYIALALFLPYMGMALVLIAITDSVMNLRLRYREQQT